MPTGIEELWKALEADATAGKTGTRGWLLRLARPEAGCPLFAALKLSSRRPAVLPRLPRDSVPGRRLWPCSKGSDPFAAELECRAHFGVALKEPRFNDVFPPLTTGSPSRAVTHSQPCMHFQLLRSVAISFPTLQNIKKHERRR